MHTFRNKQKKEISFQLKETAVDVLRADQSVQTIPLTDVIGVLPAAPDSTAPFPFEFRYFQTRDVKYGKYGFKTLKDRAIVIVSLFTDDMLKVHEFRDQLLALLHANNKNGYVAQKLLGSNVTYYKHACVVINPHSGKGGAKKLWDFAKPSLVANGYLLTEVLSVRAGFVVEYMESVELDVLLSFDVFICVSGDGTPFEIINGYMHREDIDHEKHRLTLQMLPAGSGCALLENSMKMSGNTTTLENAIYSLVHIKRYNHRLQFYQLLKAGGEVETMYGFMSAQYGFLADVDIESEALRFMGRARFDVWGTVRAMAPTKRKDRIFLPTKPEVVFPAVDQPIDQFDGIQLIDHSIWSFYMSSVEYLSTEYRSSPAIAANRGLMDVQIFPDSLGKIKFIKYLLRHTDYKVPNSIGLINLIIHEWRIEFNNQEENRDPLFVVDGESLKSKKLLAVQVKASDRIVDFLI